MSETNNDTLYARLGGYEAIVAVTDDLLPRLTNDPQLGRFWANRGADGIRREKQLLVDFLCASSGGPMYYTGRDMGLTHKGMKISSGDWDRFMGHIQAMLDTFQVGQRERSEVLAFVESTKADIVEN
ncbi:MAG: group 1 truncated hemoglobin [Nitrospirota bacterium]|nr:group 1 truncated hemoglobin [Nitrospirota bacterium]